MEDTKAKQFSGAGCSCNDDTQSCPRTVTGNYFSIFAAQIHSKHNNTSKAEKVIKTHTGH